MPSETPTVDAELETLIRARYPIIYVVSWEERRVEETLREVCQRRGKKLVQWTVTSGLGGNVAARDPLAALDQILAAPDQSVFLLKDFHPFMNDHMVVRKLRDLIFTLKTSYKTIVLLSPQLKLPMELEKEISVVDYQLPTVKDLDRLLEGIIQSVKGNTTIDVDLTPTEREQVLKAASGLTSNEAENVFARSLVEKRTFDIDVILGEKEQIIRKSGILEYYRTDESMGDVGGMDLLKGWMNQRTASFSDKAREYGLPEPKGMLLLGVQGCGKSLTAKAIAGLWRLPLLRLDVGKIFGGIVGQSEENIRKAIATAESVSPCVAGETRITLADGTEETIENLYEGNSTELSVLGMDEQFKIVPVRVSAITRREAPDLYQLTLRHSTLKATSNHLHPVLRDGRLVWVRTDTLKKGDFVAVPREIPTRSDWPATAGFLSDQTRVYSPEAFDCLETSARTPQRSYSARVKEANYGRIAEMAHWPTWNSIEKFVIGHGGTTDSTLTKIPEFLTPEIAYILGLIDSDGYLSPRRVGFVNTDLELHDRFRAALVENFGVSVARMQSASKESLLSGTGENSQFKPCFVSYTDNKFLANLLREVQSRLLTMPKSFLQSYLRGYFDGDGCISNPATGAPPKVIYTCKVPAKNQLLRSLLLRAGFMTMNPTSHDIEITGWENVQRFIEQIGSDHPMRSQRMQQWQETTPPIETKDRSDVIPVGSLLRECRNLKSKGSNHFQSASSSLIHYYETGKGNPSRTKLAKISTELENSPEMERLIQADVSWSEVREIKQIETPEYVYDLCCEGVHNFVANNIVTHNCILWTDELEKGFSGTQSSGISDGGTTARVFGTFLAWMQDKKHPVFVVATSNDVTSLPPELLRKGRFDEIFFVDLPNAEERAEIFSIHLKKRKRDVTKFDLMELGKLSVGFSGAEIEQTVVSALFGAFDEDAREVRQSDLVKSVKESVPLSVTMRERIAELREWADERARPVSSVQGEDTSDILLAEYTSKLAEESDDEEEEDEKEDDAPYAMDGPGGGI
jgi:ATP-dependent 26S proteasome regulatory subunit